MDDFDVSTSGSADPQTENKSYPQKVKPLFGGKGFFKHWTGVVLLIILAVLVTWGLLNLPTILNVVQGQLTAWQYQWELNKLEKPYKTDKIGGKTPEETFDMFISALKKSDIDLASKYFVIQKQGDWKKILEGYQKGNILTDLVLELEEAKGKLEKSPQITSENTLEFTYLTRLEKDTEADFSGQKINLKAGNYRNSVIFEKYPSGVWKINLL